jgi:hypothetical protein
MKTISTHVQRIQFKVMWLIKRKKNLVHKNQGQERIYRKYKANESTRTHNPKKNKSKQSTKEKR